MRQTIVISVLCVIFSLHTLPGQNLRDQAKPPVTKADSLRGAWSPERSCYDITYYDLDVRIDPELQSVHGSNTIRFRVVEPFEKLQVDLFENMEIGTISLDEVGPLRYEREYGAVFVHMPRVLEKGSLHNLRILYSGKPIVAKRPPWEGGFTWTKDSTGNPWVAVTCQETGASLWWPNKDHQADEPDSMMIRVSVPPGLEDVSNGRLRRVVPLPDTWSRYEWFVSYPINNYNVTVNIGKFSHFADIYHGENDVTLDYYVMPYDLGRAQKQFEQVKPMMRCFEERFGPYPFARDGYKLVQAPHLGMEHQSAVAYGNDYLQGYRGRASSPVGLMFDFIIIHESAHEWWGNSVTSKDIADMWIHESFGAYAEAIYVECLYGYEAAMAYVNGKKQNVRNQQPIIGTYGVNKPGAGDMYDKGQLVLNTLRHVLDNDSLWFSILRTLATTFRCQTISSDDVFGLLNAMAGAEYSYFFDQYLRHSRIPVLEMAAFQKGDTTTVRYRWDADVEGFRMPLRVTLGGGSYRVLYPTTQWQSLKIANVDPASLKVPLDWYYIEVKKTIGYIDPQRPVDR